MMNMQTPKGEGAMENTKERILISADRTFQPGVDPRNEGMLRFSPTSVSIQMRINKNL